MCVICSTEAQSVHYLVKHTFFSSLVHREKANVLDYPVDHSIKLLQGTDAGQLVSDVCARAREGGL